MCVSTPLPTSRTLATNSDRSLSALWGKLASEILMEQWEVATDDLMKLREIIDSDSFAPILQQLQQRTWLMHWSLYIFFNHDNGRNQIIDLFFQDRCGRPSRDRSGCGLAAPLSLVQATLNFQNSSDKPGRSAAEVTD